ncbi:hypothetical protein NW77_067 [Erwinia phage phiEa2809]|uniref:Uncharacterized protein n=1 Tax=Erwinia phage phiEa2809 TaxID=1564096 RepID=A0A0A0YSS7_9CAUD|nr:hypothetical protein NW77_067 [Erwinia phage phiEa2809]AIX13075.1 hypothetical protein NW77_067 [Erwinia phage phiEa2809]
MKSFSDFLITEADASLNQGKSAIPGGVKVKIKSDLGWQDVVVTQITPDSKDDEKYWEISMGGKVHGRITQDHVKGLGPNDERILTIDKADFWLGGRQASGKFFESANQGGDAGKPVNEKVDHRKMGTMGRYALEDGDTLPTKGQDIDFYDRQGDKKYGKVTSVNIRTISVKTSDGTLHKMDVVKP